MHTLNPTALPAERVVQHNAMTCHVCGRHVPAGRAVLRSLAFQQTAFHADCYATRYPTA